MAFGRKELQAFSDQIESVVDNLDRYSYYQLLGVADPNKTSLITYNYNLRVHEYRQVQKHRDCSGALYQRLDRLIARLEEAHEVLSQPRLKAEYDAGLGAGQMRHPEMLGRGPKVAPPPLAGEPDPEIERLSQNLERRIRPEYVDEQAERERQQARRKAKGPLRGVRSGADLRRQLYREERQRVAGEQYLDKVEQKLRGELAAMGVDTEARAEEEQQQGWDAEYVDELDSQLREELAAMGVDTARKDDPESEVGESIDREYVEGLETKLRHELYRMGVKPDAAPASRRRERLVDEAPAKQVDLGALGAQLAQLDTRPDNVVDDELVEMEYGAPAERPAPTAPEPAEARPTDEPDLAAPIAIDEQQDGEEKQPAAAPAAPQGEAAPAEAATAAAAPSSSPQIEGAQPEAAPEAPQPEAAPEAPQPEAVSRGPRRRRIPHHTPAAPVPAVKDAPDGEWVIELPDDE